MPLNDYYSSGNYYNDRLNNLLHLVREGKRSGIKFDDVARASLWSVEDWDAFNKELRLIQTQQLPGDTIDKKLDRRFNDHRDVRFEKGESFEPLAITPVKYDMVTLLGMNHLAKLGVGKLLPAFSHYAAGTGTTPEHLSDSRLVAEIQPRISVISDGYREDIGAGMRFLGRFPTTTRTAMITEGAVFNADAGGVPLFRTVFTVDDYINHRQYNTFFSLSQTVTMISVT